MRVLIADDEKLSRASLISMLDETEYNVTVAGEVSNGEELLKALPILQPDVAFVDIRMPKMNGLEAIELGRSLSPHTQWVILSGYSEFDYARKALSLGAFMYLLKPLGMDELESVLNLLVTRIAQTYRRLDDEFEHSILAALNNGYPTSLAESASEPPNFKYKMILIAADTKLPEQMEQAKRHLENVMEDTVGGWSSLICRVAVFSLTAGETAVALCWQEHERMDGQRMESAADSIYHRAAAGAEQEISYTLVDSKSGVSMAEMLGDLQDIRRLLPLRVVMGINQRYSLEELKQQNPAALHLGTVMIRLADYYQRHLYMDYCRELEEMLTLLRTGEYSSRQLQHLRNFIRNGMAEYSKPDTAELTDLLTGLADQLLANKNKQDGHPQDMISEVIHYIEQHYVSNISISELAAKLSITPNYLSATFHKKTGTTFTKYLTRLRIHRAKELLSSTNLPVKEIALEVGYYSTRHFVKLFVESEGCYPTEFKKQARQ